MLEFVCGGGWRLFGEGWMGGDAGGVFLGGKGFGFVFVA